MSDDVVTRLREVARLTRDCVMDRDDIADAIEWAIDYIENLHTADVISWRESVQQTKHIKGGFTVSDDIVTRPEQEMDFVEYLRLWASVDANDQAIRDLHKAADEIERLRDALIECESVISRLKIEKAYTDGL